MAISGKLRLTCLTETESKRKLDTRLGKEEEEGRGRQADRQGNSKV